MAFPVYGCLFFLFSFFLTDAAGEEVIKGERQWRVKANTEHSKKHSKIVGVSISSLRIYDEHGSVPLSPFSFSWLFPFSPS